MNNQAQEYKWVTGKLLGQISEKKNARQYIYDKALSTFKRLLKRNKPHRD